MKFVKLSIIALSLGLFVASCGSGNGENKPTDSTAATTAPAHVDTTTAPPAKPADSTTTASPAPEAKK